LFGKSELYLKDYPVYPMKRQRYRESRPRSREPAMFIVKDRLIGTVLALVIAASGALWLARAPAATDVAAVVDCAGTARLAAR
jgi:cell division septal protein FtsQ